MNTAQKGAYGPDDDIVDYILGITFEIWEERGVELIRQYYAEDCIVWGLDGITHGADEVVDATYATLDAFPDRNLLAENVIWSGNRTDGYYSSHRLLSKATNEGPTIYGPATGKPVRMTNIADCVIEDGMITKEWLVRDNMMFASQLSADPISAARDMRRRRTDEHQAWLDSEAGRVRETAPAQSDAEPVSPSADPETFARQVVASQWTGDRASFDRAHAPYTVLHRSPFRHFSGRDAVFGYYESLRAIVGDASFTVDHVAAQPFSSNGVDLAVRWSVTGTHAGEVMGVAPTGRPLYILGVTHWRCIADRIAVECTVFDDLAVLSQVLDP
ncbi:MAG: ester cyclase [Pseudomonadota bacterium]